MFRTRSSRRLATALVVAGTFLGGGALEAQEGDEGTAADAAEGGKSGADALKNSAWTKVEQDAEKGYKEPLKAGGPFDGAAREFVVRKAIPQLANDVNKPIIDRVRRRMREILLGGISDERAFDDASKAVAEGALAIARKGEASRAARVNAVLLIGELRARDGKDGTVWTPAASVLAGIAGDAAVDPSVRVAAMAGLVRHADAARRAGGDAIGEFAKTARPAILAIVAEPTAAEQTTVNDWLASRALSLVTTVVKSSPKELAATLVGVMKDSKRSLDVRIRAAAALGATVTPKSEIQAVEAVESITSLAVAALEADEETLRDRRYELQLGGGGPAGGNAPMSPMMGMRPGMGMPPGAVGAIVSQLVPDQALRRTAWRLVTLGDAILTADGKAGVATLLSGEDKDNSKAYADLYREHGLAIDKARNDDALIDALSALRPDEEAPLAAAGDASASDTDSDSGTKPADDTDPFSGK